MLYDDRTCGTRSPVRLGGLFTLALHPICVHKQPSVVTYHIAVMLHIGFHRRLRRSVCLLIDMVKFIKDPCRCSLYKEDTIYCDALYDNNAWESPFWCLVGIQLRRAKMDLRDREYDQSAVSQPLWRWRQSGCKDYCILGPC
jgi:hypothetical protein